METHAHELPTTCTDQSELSFETAESSVQHNQSTAGTDELPADVQPGPPTVPADRPSSIATDLPWRHQAQEGEAISTVSAKSYKIHTSIGHTRMYSQAAVLDTGCGPCLIHRSTLRPEWLAHERPPPPTKYTGATGTPVRISGLMDLDVQIGDLRKSVTFAVVDDLAVPLIIGTAYQDKFIESIRCTARRLKPINSRSIAILDTFDSSVCTLESPEDAQPKGVRVCKRTVIPPMSEVPVRVRTSASGLRLISQHERAAQKQSVLCANGLMEVIPNQPFTILVSNFTNAPRKLPKHMTIAWAEPPPDYYVPLADTACTEAPVETVAAVQRDELRLSKRRSACVQSHVTQSHKKAITEARDWHETVQIGSAFEDRRDEVLQVLEPHHKMWDGHLGQMAGVEHHIDLMPDAKPLRSVPYRAGIRMRDIEKAEVDKMVEQGVAVPAPPTDWAAPVVFAPKKDGTLRFCVDYRRLNAMTVRDAYPIPRMDECIESLGDAKVFSTLDANSGYWQILIAPKDRDKTTFTTHFGTYAFTRMPFGLKNAPATYQRAIDTILTTVKWQFALVYLDDIIVFSSSFEDHKSHLRTVLKLLEAAGVTLRLAKSKFFHTEVDYLGHVIKPGALEIAPDMIRSVQEATPPRTVRGVRSFLGLCNVYRRFVKGFSRIAAPLNDLLRKGQPQRWESLEPNAEKAFHALKDTLAKPPILALPRRSGHITVETDACDRQLGAVLLQAQADGTNKPIGFFSRSLTSAERNYDTTERECLAVVWACLLLRPYIELQRFTVITDHEALKWLLTYKESTGRLARWRLRLLEYDFDIQYRKGIKHQAADALSRLETNGHDTAEIDDNLPGDLTIGSIAEDSEALDLGDTYDDSRPYLDTFVNTDVIANVTTRSRKARVGKGGERVTLPEAYAQEPAPLSPQDIIRAQARDRLCRMFRDTVGTPGSEYSVDGNGLLIRKSPLDQCIQIVAPEGLRKRIMYFAHNSVHAGHPGSSRMYSTLRRSYYWPNMAGEVQDYVAKCQSCLRTKGTQYRSRRELRLFPATEPLSFVALDLLGPLPKSKSGHEHVLVITDRFTKFTRAIPLKSTTSQTVTDAFLQYWAYAYGVPDRLLSDNGPQFTARYFQHALASLGIKHVPTSTYHPQTNGQTERYNSSIIARLRHYVAEHQRNWDTFVQPLTYAYNTQVHRSTKCTPLELVTSRQPNGPLPFPAMRTSEDPLSAEQFKIGLLTHLRSLMDRARTNTQRSAESYKKYHDRSAKPPPNVRVGD